MYQEPIQTSEMEFFANIVNIRQHLIEFLTLYSPFVLLIHREIFSFCFIKVLYFSLIYSLPSLFFLISLVVHSFYTFAFIFSPQKIRKKLKYNGILNVSSLSLHISNCNLLTVLNMQKYLNSMQKLLKVSRFCYNLQVNVLLTKIFLDFLYQKTLTII